jgi:hypothetical protein
VHAKYQFSYHARIGRAKLTSFGLITTGFTSFAVESDMCKMWEVLFSTVLNT